MRNLSVDSSWEGLHSKTFVSLLWVQLFAFVLRFATVNSTTRPPKKGGGAVAGFDVGLGEIVLGGRVDAKVGGSVVPSQCAGVVPHRPNWIDGCIGDGLQF